MLQSILEPAWMAIAWLILGSAGMPLGERDPALIHLPSADATIYFEWAGRGVGQSGGVGLEGMAADEEVRGFLNQLKQAIDRAADETEDAETVSIDPRAARLANTLTLTPGCLYLVARTPDPATWTGALVISPGAERITAILEQAAFLWPESAAVDPHEPVARVAIHWEQSNIHAVLHQAGDRLILAFGPRTLDQVLQRLSSWQREGKQPTPPLASNPRFQRAIDATRLERVAQLAWIDGPQLPFIALLGGARPEVVTLLQNAFPFAALESAAYCMGYEDRHQRQRLAVLSPEDRPPLFAQFGGASLEPFSGDHIPADADLLVAASLNLTRIRDGLRDALRAPAGNAAKPPAWEDFERLINDAIGVSITDDLLPAFGDHWVECSSPSVTALTTQETVTFVDVRDHEKARRVFQAGIELLEARLNDSGTDDDDAEMPLPRKLKTHQFLGHEIHYLVPASSPLLMEGETSDAETWTAFCLTENQLILASTPSALKGYLRFRQSADKPATFPATTPAADWRERFAPFPHGTASKGELIFAVWLPRSAVWNPCLDYIQRTFTNCLLMENLGGDSTIMEEGWIPSPMAILPYAQEISIQVRRSERQLTLEARDAWPLFGMLIMQGDELFNKFKSVENARQPLAAGVARP